MYAIVAHVRCAKGLAVVLQVPPRVKRKKKLLFLFDYACHPCTGTMLIFSVYLAVCLMPDPKTGPLFTHNLTI